MGTYYTQGASKTDIVEELKHDKMIRHKLVGNVLWTVEEYDKDGDTYRFIGCYLLSQSNGFGWGYKPMDETMGPLYYTCPISFFDLVPMANYGHLSEKTLGFIRQFREECRNRVR